MSCRRATELISASMDRPLTARERIALVTHLAICTACRRYRKHLQTVSNLILRCGDALDRELEETPLSAAARERIARALDEG